METNASRAKKIKVELGVFSVELLHPSDKHIFKALGIEAS
jgi:hypothetical protein